MSDDTRPKKRPKTDSSRDEKKDDVVSNPYLAHLKSEKKTLPVLIPGQTTAEQQVDVEEGAINPFSGRPFTPHYFEILKKRRNLPVQKQRQEFLDMVHKSQCVVLVGETGSGKTTQWVSLGVPGRWSLLTEISLKGFLNSCSTMNSRSKKGKWLPALNLVVWQPCRLLAVSRRSWMSPWAMKWDTAFVLRTARPRKRCSNI